MAVAIASRALAITVALLAVRVVPASPDSAHWNRSDTVLAPLLRWDAGYYLEIAARGYDFATYTGGTTTHPFFPLYPLCVRMLAATGLGAPAAAVLLANVAWVAALVVLAVLLRDRFGDAIARRACVLVALQPWAAFASFPYTESLFLFLAACSLLYLGRGRLMVAAVWAALASATRPVGIGLALAIALVAWRGPRSFRDRLAPLVAGGGLGAFMVYLAITLGSPLAFIEAQSNPTFGRFARNPLLTLLLAPARSLYRSLHGRFDIIDVDVWVLIAAVALLAWQRAALPTTWLTYGAVALAMPLASASLISMGRYVVPLFPIHVAAALALEGRPRLTALVTTLSAIAMCVIAARYATWRWAG